ncbi:PepSY-like domain-containing protein [Blastopirellula marina]|nr:PepSY-like domain-containing protein [Blastopirellula marina]
MRFIMTCVAVGVIAGGSLARVGVAEEKPVSLDKLPEVVSAAVKKMFPQAKLVKATSEEEEEDEREYEVTLIDGDKTIDVTVDEEGEVESLEMAIPLDALPKKVTKTLRKRYADWKPASAEAIYEIEDGERELEYYEILLQSTDSKQREVKIQPNGKIAHDEHEHDEADDED